MEAEAAKGRMDAELLQVSKIAASMESRLREAQAAADSARTTAATADRRAYEVGAAASIGCHLAAGLVCARPFGSMTKGSMMFIAHGMPLDVAH